MGYFSALAGDGPGETLLSPRHFQVAYATHDVDAAVELIGQRYGVANFSLFEDRLQAGGTVRIRLVRLGPTVIELIEPHGEGAAFFLDHVKPNAVMGLHHLGYLVTSEQQWDALHAAFAAQGMPVAGGFVLGDIMRASYVWSPEFGHYLEYVQPRSPAGWDVLDAIPAN